MPQLQKKNSNYFCNHNYVYTVVGKVNNNKAAMPLENHKVTKTIISRFEVTSS